MKRHAIGYIKGVSAAISYGTNPLFALPLFSAGIGVNSVLFYRYIIASIIYGLWLVLAKKISLKLKKKEILPIFILAILFSLSSVTLFDAFNYIASGIACTILFIYPTMVALIMFLFFKEKPSKSLVFAIFLATIGIVFYIIQNQVNL